MVDTNTRKLAMIVDNCMDIMCKRGNQNVNLDQN